jgi:hypothetical protein
MVILRFFSRTYTSSSVKYNNLFVRRPIRDDAVKTMARWKLLLLLSLLLLAQPQQKDRTTTMMMITVVTGFTTQRQHVVPPHSRIPSLRDARINVQHQEFSSPITTSTTSSSTSSTTRLDTFATDDEKEENTTDRNNANANTNRKRIFQLPIINTIETNRIYRRFDNTYIDQTHADWVKHRSSKRIFRHIKTIRKSIIYQTIRKPVRSLAWITVYMLLWNSSSILARTVLKCAATTATTATAIPPAIYSSSSISYVIASILYPILRFVSKLPVLHVPMDQLALTSPMLGLLLGTHSFAFSFPDRFQSSHLQNSWLCYLFVTHPTVCLCVSLCVCMSVCVYAPQKSATYQRLL